MIMKTAGSKKSKLERVVVFLIYRIPNKIDSFTGDTMT